MTAPHTDLALLEERLVGQLLAAVGLVNEVPRIPALPRTLMQEAANLLRQQAARIAQLESAVTRINGLAQNTCYNVSQMPDDWTLDKQAVLRNADDIGSIARSALKGQADER